jgi:glycosyltransferase involved in cell wall biosynthesis
MSAAVSVIIPCRNAAAWLGDAIESCLGQSWRDLQIIVVDNGSTDGSLELARRYESRGITMLECVREGAGVARNLGLALAEGKFIQFLDADDVLHADKIRVQVERLTGAPPDTIASGAWARFRRSPSEAAFSLEPVWCDLAPEQFLITSWRGGGMMPNFAWLTPRALIEAAGPWNEDLSLNDDGEFFSRVVLAASGIVFCDAARGYYRMAGAASMSGRRDRVALASAFAAVDLSCRHLERRCASAAAARACATHYQRFAYDAYPDAPDLVEAAERRAAELGGSDLRAPGGRSFSTLSRCFGWKFAKHCQLAWRKRAARMP